MKRIIIVCEGHTEQSFCNDVLQPHFNSKEIGIEMPSIKKTGGGIVNWEALKYQIEKHLLEDKTAYVTTLIDYYGIHLHHKFPNWNAAQQVVDKNEVVTQIELGMLQNLKINLQHRFVPYIQLHEFECLLFSDINVFTNNFEKHEFLDYSYLEATIKDHPNPELINNGNETAPSKRLAKIISGYYSDSENNKSVYGALLAQEIGLPVIRQKCVRFNNWINKLEQI